MPPSFSHVPTQTPPVSSSPARSATTVPCPSRPPPRPPPISFPRSPRLPGPTPNSSYPSQSTTRSRIDHPFTILSAESVGSGIPKTPCYYTPITCPQGGQPTCPVRTCPKRKKNKNTAQTTWSARFVSPRDSLQKHQPSRSPPNSSFAIWPLSFPVLSLPSPRPNKPPCTPVRHRHLYLHTHPPLLATRPHARTHLRSTPPAGVFTPRSRSNSPTGPWCRR